MKKLSRLLLGLLILSCVSSSAFLVGSTSYFRISTDDNIIKFESNNPKKDNIGISYSYDNSSNIIENQILSATANDALNFIANFDGSMNELQNIQDVVKDAYKNHGLSKEYHDTFIESFNTYLMLNI